MYTGHSYCIFCYFIDYKIFKYTFYELVKVPVTFEIKINQSNSFLFTYCFINNYYSN